jgi:acetoin utilization deacetylase AcuC-like enzyme
MRCFYSANLELPLPVGHPFPAGKFQQTKDMLLDDGILRPEEIIAVPAPDPLLLRMAHEAGYIERVASGALDRREQLLLGLPPSPGLFARAAAEVEATRQACHAALAEGVAVSLAGGNHRAFRDHGEGFSVFNDVAVAVRDLQLRHPNIRIMVVDTDARSADGTHALLAGDPRVFTYSIHARNPGAAAVAGSLDVETARYVEGEMYLRQLFLTLADALDSFAPDLVIWVSGVDNHHHDLVGRMNLTHDDLARRDEVLLGALLRNRVPVAVLFGGGFNRQTEVTAQLHRNTVATAKRLAAACRGL